MTKNGKAGMRKAAGVLIGLILPSTVLAQAPSRIAVLPFESQTRYVKGAIASDLFDSYIVKHSSVAIVERTQLDKIIGEQYLEQHSGTVDSETAGRIRQLLGVEGLVIGNVLAVDHDVNGGAGTMMMHARLVDSSTGRILWADTVTARVHEGLKRKVVRFFSGAAADSDAVVTGRLIEEGTAMLAQRMNSSLGSAPRDLAAELAAAQPAPRITPELDCAGAEKQISRLAESVISEEALYWAAKLKSNSGVDENPGQSYSDKALRRRLNSKILFWMDEGNPPKLSARQLERLADAKEEMRRLRSQCTDGSLIASGRMR